MAKGDFKTKRKPGPGRPKGLKNKVPTEAKAYVMHVFDTLQKNPKQSLLAMAKANPPWFYDSIWKVLIPKQVNTDVNIGLSANLMDLAIQAARSISQPTPATPPAGLLSPGAAAGTASGEPPSEGE